MKEEDIKKDIEKRIKRLLRHGKKKEVDEFLKLQVEGDIEDEKMFWNMIACFWSFKVPQEIRGVIKKKLSSLKGKNLSLGCGNHPYVKNSVLVDFSSEMLARAKGKEKIILDLNKGKLPFKDKSFDSVTMVFIVDYLTNLSELLKEVKRVLKDKGKLVIVNSKKPIDDYYRRYENKHLEAEDLKVILKGFSVKISEKQVDNRILNFVEAI